MGTIEYFKLGTTELINHGRLARYNKTLKISQVRKPTIEDTVWLTAGSGIGTAPSTGSFKAPWYDSNDEVSREFAGLLCLDVAGLSDSTLAGNPTEYITDGGAPGRYRNATKGMVFTVVLVAQTQRGADYGLRWLNTVLRDQGCGPGIQAPFGSEMEFYRYPAPKGVDYVTDVAALNLFKYESGCYLRRVKTTASPRVVKKQTRRCGVFVTVTFTLVAADPYTYGLQATVFSNLGPVVGEAEFGDTPPFASDTGHTTFPETRCPTFDYSPIVDPQYPATVEPPSAPSFLPDGWLLPEAAPVYRGWAEIGTRTIPQATRVVPILNLSCDTETRMVRVRVYNTNAGPPETVCAGLLWEAIITYIPEGVTLTIDTVKQQSYVRELSTGIMRRADGLVYGPDATPILWPEFTCGMNLRFTVEDFDNTSTVRLALALAAKDD